MLRSAEAILNVDKSFGPHVARLSSGALCRKINTSSSKCSSAAGEEFHSGIQSPAGSVAMTLSGITCSNTMIHSYSFGSNDNCRGSQGSQHYFVEDVDGLFLLLLW